MALLWITAVWITLATYSGTCQGQFDFGTIYDFDLTTDVSLPTNGDDVTLSCRRTERYNRKISQNFIDQGDKITWEMNDRNMFATGLDQQGRCVISPESNFLGRPNFGPSRNIRYPNITCEDDGTTAKLTVHGWKPSQLSGDAWRCLQFPFAESAKLVIQNFVAVTTVTIKQVIDRRNHHRPSRGTFVTCRTSPCRPHAVVEWYIKDDGADLLITPQANSQEEVDTGRNGLSVTTTTVLFTSDDDHDKEVYCTASNSLDQVPIQSQNISIIMKYAPTITLQVTPDASVAEGSDVTLHCAAFGRPKPEVKWTRKAKSETEEDALVSLMPSFTLSSVSVSDGAEYVCQATNGMEPDAAGSVVLFVREKPASMENSRVISKVTNNDLREVDSATADHNGAVAGGVIAALIIVVLVVVIIWLVLRHRRSKRRNIDNNSRLPAFGNGDESQGIYATCSSLPRAPQVPPYMEVLPPPADDQKLSKVSNPGYGMGDAIIAGNKFSRRINANRPLPGRPLECDSGYEEIDDSAVSGTIQNEPAHQHDKLKHHPSETTKGSCSTAHLVNDGYEVPINVKTLSQGDLTLGKTSSSGVGDRRRFSVSSTSLSTQLNTSPTANTDPSRRQSGKFCTNEGSFDTPF